MDNSKTYFGFAQVDITPEVPVQTVGFGRTDETSRGVLDPLMAQVSVWRRGEETCLLAAIDHIGFSKANADALRTELGGLLGVGKEKVMLCFSHTHSAPNDTLEPEYFALLKGRVLAAAQQAKSAMTPVLAAWGNGAAHIGLNRRTDGEKLDSRLGVLKVSGENGELKLILLRLTAHNNVLKADNYMISADYFGAVRQTLSQKYGCPVMVTQGASGDVAPRFFCSSIDPPDVTDDRFIRSGDALELMAQSVLADARPVIDAISPKPIEQLAAYSKTIALYADVPSYDRALEIADEAQRYCGIPGDSWLGEVHRLNGEGITCQRDDTEVQYFAVGGGCLCGVANEIMCEFALDAARLTGSDAFYFGGYTNGSAGYFPTAAEFDKGGYEVYWSMLIYYIYYHRVFPLRRESAKRLIEFAAENAPETM